MIKALATDLDGTLFYPKRKVRLMRSKNKRFLKEFIENGKKVILVTGRNMSVSKKVAAALETNKMTIIGCNGSFVIEGDNLIMENPIPSNDAVELYRMLKKDKKINSILIFTNKYNILLDDQPLNFFFKIVGAVGMKAQGVYNESFKLVKKNMEKYLQEEDVRVYKIMPWYGLNIKGKQVAYEASLEYQKSVGDKFDISWSKDAVEFVKYGVNKAVILEQVIKSENITKDEIVVIGDSGNDISMFNAFPNSFVMKHSPDEVKKHAKHVVESVADLKEYCK